MNLYLVQHADALSKEEDPDRPLSAQGRKDVSHVVAYIKEHLATLAVDQIFHTI